MIDLSIIIVSFNTKKLLASCISSIITKTKEVNYEIIVIDNASVDGSSQMVKKNFPEVKLIINNKNLGFAKANNQGIKTSKGKYFLLLNSDTLVTANVLAGITSWMDKNPKVGIATCGLKNRDNSMQATGGYFPTLFRVFAWMFFLDDIPLLGRVIKSFHPHIPDFFGINQSYLQAHEQDWITGAFFLIRAEVVKQVGVLDEDFFMYVEEMEYCYRVKKTGWQVWFLPKWSIIHYGGSSGLKENALLGEITGLKKFYKKHMKNWQYNVMRIFIKSGSFLRMILFGILKGKEYARIYQKAFIQS